MDKHLKERLVGAGVLMAIAIILIPEMLSGPRSTDKSNQASTQTLGQTSGQTSNDPSSDNAVSSEGTKLKTYTIDLSKSTAPATAPPEPPPVIAETPQSAQRSEEIVTTAAPPVEETPSPAVAVPSKPEPARPATPAAESRPPVAPVGEKRSNAQPPRTEPSRSDAGSAAVANGWSVQVGSFGVRATSDRIAGDLRNAGLSSFVVAFQANGQTMYRVRVGPARDRAAAEALLRKVKPQYPNATLVAPQ